MWKIPEVCSKKSMRKGGRKCIRMSMKMSIRMSRRWGMRLRMRNGMTISTGMSISRNNITGESIKKHIWKKAIDNPRQSAEKAAAHGRQDQINSATWKRTALHGQSP